MNAAQYKIVKTMTNFPKFDTKKFAAMIKLDHSEVLRVQASLNYEQYKNKETPMDSIFGNMFGGSNPFGSGL